MSAPQNKFRKVFRNRIRTLLAESGKTQVEISEGIGINKRMFNNYVTGKFIPTIETLASICDYFEVSADWILGRTEKRREDDETGEQDFGNDFGDGAYDHADSDCHSGNGRGA